MDALTYRLEFHGSLSHLLEGFPVMVSHLPTAWEGELFEDIMYTHLQLPLLFLMIKWGLKPLI